MLGLAWDSINTVQPSAVQTPVDNLISQNLVPSDAQLFTAHLGEATIKNDNSFYTFGYIDQDVVSSTGGQITYAAVDNSQGFWMFDSTSAVVNGKTITRSGNTAIADTGTTLALVDDETVKAIYDAIPNSKYDSTQQGYVFPTDTSTDQLPTITFAVGDTQIAVQKSALAFADAGSGYTYGGIQSRGTNSFDILGDTFLKGVYAVCFILSHCVICRLTYADCTQKVFDVGNVRFGAVARPDTTSSSSSS